MRVHLVSVGAAGGEPRAVASLAGHITTPRSGLSAQSPPRRGRTVAEPPTVTGRPSPMARTAATIILAPGTPTRFPFRPAPRATPGWLIVT